MNQFGFNKTHKKSVKASSFDTFLYPF